MAAPSGSPGGAAGKPRQDREVATVFRLHLSGVAPAALFWMDKAIDAQNSSLKSGGGVCYDGGTLMKLRTLFAAWMLGLFCLVSAPVTAQDEATEEKTEETAAAEEETPKVDKKRQSALAGWVKKELVVAKKAAAMVKKAAKKPAEAEKMAKKLEKMAEPYLDLYGPAAKADATVTERKLTVDEITEAQKPFGKQRAIVLKNLEKYMDDYADAAERSYDEAPEEFVPAVQVFIKMMTD